MKMMIRRKMMTVMEMLIWMKESTRMSLRHCRKRTLGLIYLALVGQEEVLELLLNNRKYRRKSDIEFNSINNVA